MEYWDAYNRDLERIDGVTLIRGEKIPDGLFHLVSDVIVRPYDVSYEVGNGKFNYRVCGIMIHDSSILAMHDERSPYYYLPGGRVKMGETAESAIVREVEEELGIVPRIIRPLWLNQGLFTEDIDKLNYHELCIYFLLDVLDTGLLEKGDKFTLHERHHTHEFEWLPFERLEKEYFYPIFLKTEITNLPENFTLRTEFE